jgi:hypothetical protein
MCFPLFLHTMTPNSLPPTTFRDRPWRDWILALAAMEEEMRTEQAAHELANE